MVTTYHLTHGNEGEEVTDFFCLMKDALDASSLLGVFKQHCDMGLGQLSYSIVLSEPRLTCGTDTGYCLPLLYFTSRFPLSVLPI